MANPKLCSIPDCGKPIKSRGWCTGHYQRWNKHGNPLGGGTSPGEALRFYREVVLPYDGDECLVWPYATKFDGYGMLWLAGRPHIVSRLVCEDANGPAPTPKHDAAHSCGQGRLGCVAKRHLSWKTRLENVADSIAHGTFVTVKSAYATGFVP